VGGDARFRRSLEQRVTTSAESLSEVARRAAEVGATVALRWRDRAAALQLEEKTGPRDLVSVADRDTEKAIRSVLAELRPDDGVLGEEYGPDSGSSGIRWAIDPIDGTTSYLYGRADWAVSVAVYREADRKLLAAAVAEPSLGATTVAWAGGGTHADGPTTAAPRDPSSMQQALVEVNFGREDQKAAAGAMIAALVERVRDVRRGGSAAAALAHLATRRADAVWAPGLQPWDCAAGVLLVLEAGGVVGDLDGPTPDTWPLSGDVLAASPALWPELREILTRVYV
jgi:myo-inositol-1(or 4)-monophosphatase